MIVDLRADSARWRQEQRATGTRGKSKSASPPSLSGNTEPDMTLEPYVGSTTYQQSSAGRPVRRDGDSPRAADYGASRDRIPVGRLPVDSMDIDPPTRSSMYTGAPSGRGGYPPDSRHAYPADRGYPPEPPMSNPQIGRAHV